MRAFERERYDKGLCIQCAEAKPEGEKRQRCEACRTVVNENSARYFQTHRRRLTSRRAVTRRD